MCYSLSLQAAVLYLLILSIHQMRKRVRLEKTTVVQCHSGNSLNAAGGSLVLTVPKTYNPGEVYDIVVKLSRSGQTRWGFQMTALTGTNVRAGTFASVDNNTN